MTTTWTLENTGAIGLGVKFNTLGLNFNNFGTQFGGTYISIWTVKYTD